MNVKKGDVRSSMLKKLCKNMNAQNYTCILLRKCMLKKANMLDYICIENLCKNMYTYVILYKWN